MAVYCVSCGAAAPDDGIFCEECGIKLESPAADAVPTVACPACGAANPPDAAFCEECGTPIPEDAEKGGRKPGFLGTAAKVGLGGVVTGGAGIGVASVLGGGGGGAATAGATGAAAEAAAEASAEAAADAAGSALGSAGASGGASGGAGGASGGATGGAPGGATGGMPGGAPGGTPGTLGGDIPVKPPLSHGPGGPAPGSTGAESTLGGAPPGGTPPGGGTVTSGGAPPGGTTPTAGGAPGTTGAPPTGTATPPSGTATSGAPPGGTTTTPGGTPGTTGAPSGGATGTPPGGDAAGGTVVDNVRTVNVTRPGSAPDATGMPTGATTSQGGNVGAGTVSDNVRTVHVTRPHPGAGAGMQAGGLGGGAAAGAGAAGGAAGGAGLSFISLLGGIVKWGLFSIIGLVGLGLGATIVGGALIFTGNPSPCVDREIEPSTAASDALREQWDAFEDQAMSGRAVITFDETGVTSRGVEYIEEKDIPLEELQVHFCPDGLGEATGTITTPGPDIHVLLRGTLDLSGSKPRIDVREIKAGNLPDVFGGTEWIVNNIVKKSDADVLDIDADLLSLEIDDGSATLTGGP